MKPNEPSRTALMIARQRAAHQVLDHGSILDDSFAMKILREDEECVLQFATGHPLASIGCLITAARTRIAEDALSGAVERGVRQIVILGAGLDTFALRNPMANERSGSMRWTTPRRRHGNLSAWPMLK
jgi:O-methyltransferase involved in polyketide biosynthesis